MADKTFRPKRGTQSTMETLGTVLKAGEMFFEYPSTGVGTGECRIKMGDGSTAYSNLPYAIDLSTVARVSTAGTAVGSATVPVYVNSSGKVTACTSISLNTTGTATNATNVYSTLSTGTAGTYYFDFHTTASSANKALKHSANVYLYTVAGTTTTNGKDNIRLGNSTASGTTANSYGEILMYGTGAYYGTISNAQALTANRTYYLPNASGTFVTHPTWGTAVGSTYTPVYISTTGVATTCTVVNNTSATAISAAASLATNNTIYYGLPTINGSKSYSSATNIYAPTSVGTSGYVLTSSGSGAPSWTAQSSIAAGSATSATTATNATNVYSTVSTGTAGTYYFDFHTTASSANKALKHTANVNLYTYAGTTSATGYERLSLGNSTASGTDANSYGQLRMYGTGAYYGLISGNQALTANRTYYLPNASGTIVTHPTWGTAVGGTAKPVYISSTGVATAISSTVGSSTTPVYLSSGTITSTGVDLSTVGQSQGYIKCSTTSSSTTISSGGGNVILSQDLYDWTKFSSSYYCVLVVSVMFVLGSASGTAGTRIIYGIASNGSAGNWNDNENPVDTTVFRASSTQRLHYSTVMLLNGGMLTSNSTIDAYIQQDSGVSVTVSSARITAFYYPIATANVSA